MKKSCLSFNSNTKMSTHDKPVGKKQRPCLRIPFVHHRQTDLLFHKNAQRITKHPQAFPMLGELPSLAGDQCFNTTHREDYPAYTLDGIPIVWQRKVPVRGERTAQEQRSSLYQQDFPAPKRIHVRRNQVIPHPDNLAINPSMRAEYRTVQRETYPGWDVSVHARPAPAQLKRTA
ncbi:uncharacterized protein si:dkeyp-69c1.9 isoform X3 [Xyrauchen texanus]|uniref:uncharacterized protein si:dkeyp-69c1.9 isoform X3 n=1 Tax=Xyrauchen texanus TaxID=154827 RepID=UPI002241BB2C|nr:uncharacterized protein si:dkeyp-69c1.9 isoform X3 [Xyrauchen texanus]